MRVPGRVIRLASTWLLGTLLLASRVGIAGEDLPPGPFAGPECVACHADRNPTLVAAWRNGPHGPDDEAGCTDCHGDRHEGAAARARRNPTCTGCHAGPAEHSYATSKHGVIVRLEEGDWAWSQPLQPSHYRAPTCAYCHLHGADHGDTMAGARDPLFRQWICTGCHAPRYVARLSESGARLLEIGRMKRAEAEGLAARHPLGRDAVQDILEQAGEHLRNIRLGVGHQSPDYQWWHGQPALDGDLIRIRDRVATSRRTEALAPHSPRPGR